MEATAEITAAVKNVPALRFPEFEGEWVKKKLVEIAKIERGRFSPRPRNNPIYYFGQIPFVQTSDVVNSNGKIENYTQTLNKKGLAVSKLFPKGTILITIAANIGNSGVLQLDMACPDSLVGIQPKKGIDNYFLNFYLSTQQKRMDYLAPEGAQRNINIEFLNPYPVPVTSLPEQQKIASFLSAANDKIQQLSKKKELLEKYKKGVMQQIFSQQIRFKDDSSNDFPEWEEKKLIEIGKRVTLKNKKNDISFVLTNSATQGIVSQQEYFDKDIANQENLVGYYVVDVDDFIYNPRISATAPVGPIKRNKLAKGVMSPLYTVFRFEKSNLEFLEFFFETTAWHKYMKSIANYGARHDRMSITNEDFIKLPIPQPCKEEQQKITEFLSAVDNKLNYTSKQLEQAQQFKKGLLQQLFV